jgi:peptidoglycan/LPS O-acetylase OafA/YrhL
MEFMGYLRTFLALSVLVVHGYGPVPPFVFGFAAVLLFYIISGFYMAMVINEKYSKLEKWWRTFYASRFLRLYPVYFVILVMTIAFNKLAGSPDLFSSAFMNQVGWPTWVLLVLSNFTGIGLDLYPVAGLPDWRIVLIAWTITIEVEFYLFAPFLVKRPIWAIAAVLGALLALRFEVNWTSRYLLGPPVGCFFVLGVLAYRIRHDFRLERFDAPLALGGLLALPVLGYFVGIHTAKDLDVPEFWLFYIVFAIFIPFLFGATKRWRFAAQVGEMSYPLYLVHLFTFIAVTWAVGQLHNGSGPGLWQLGPVIGGTAISLAIVASVLLHIGIERPFDRLRAKLGAGRH